MTEWKGPLPDSLQEIVEDFQWSEGREKLELLLEFSEKLQPLPDWLHGRRDEMESVPECMTPVFIHACQEDGRMEYFFDVPPESPTVRGFAAILQEGLTGLSPEQVLSIPGNFYLHLGLDKVLSHQRLNGIVAMLAHAKRLAGQAEQDS
jgi:cysteine desulfuration protein SufE